MAACSVAAGSVVDALLIPSPPRTRGDVPASLVLDLSKDERPATDFRSISCRPQSVARSTRGRGRRRCRARPLTPAAAARRPADTTAAKLRPRHAIALAPASPGIGRSPAEVTGRALADRRPFTERAVGHHVHELVADRAVEHVAFALERRERQQVQLTAVDDRTGGEPRLPGHALVVVGGRVEPERSTRAGGGDAEHFARDVVARPQRSTTRSPVLLAFVVVGQRHEHAARCRRSGGRRAAGPRPHEAAQQAADALAMQRRLGRGGQRDDSVAMSRPGSRSDFGPRIAVALVPLLRGQANVDPITHSPTPWPEAVAAEPDRCRSLPLQVERRALDLHCQPSVRPTATRGSLARNLVRRQADRAREPRDPSPIALRETMRSSRRRSPRKPAARSAGWRSASAETSAVHSGAPPQRVVIRPATAETTDRRRAGPDRRRNFGAPAARRGVVDRGAADAVAVA